MMIINNMFDQFIPISIFSIPLTLIGGSICLLWIFYSSKSHWNPCRKTILQNFFNKSFVMFFEPLSSISKIWSTKLFIIFLLILSYKLLGLIPYTFSQTSHLSITFSLSLPVWLTFQLVGMFSNWKGKLSHLLPQGTPFYLIPLMMCIETLSLFIQPLTLGFRLGANLLAGHLLIFLSSCVVWEAISKSKMGIISFILLASLLMLEMAVACIQAAVFLMLSMNYLKEKLK